MTTKTTVQANEWFSKGRRVHFDPQNKCIVSKKTTSTVSVFERVANQLGSNKDANVRWLTMMPGFPDGSFGYAKVEELLNKSNKTGPRLYIEYVGQGDSDTPANYKYSTLERADLVEAQWKAHGIRRTALVTFDYSSIVMMELLKRQQNRLEKGLGLDTKIEHVLTINGGLFVDGHTHPWNTTPLLQVPVFGRMGTWFMQHSTWVFNVMMKPLFSKEYKVTKEELREMENAIKRREGSAFVSRAAGFVTEHKRIGWDFLDVVKGASTKENRITFDVVGSEKDPFEHKQVVLTKERVGMFPNMKTRVIPGGHLSTSEQAETLTSSIQELYEK